MTHYFSEDNNTLKSNPQVIAFSINNTPLKFKTDNGVFSKSSLDRGTEVLLRYLEIEDSVKTCLDLGCGYGTIGVYINKTYNISVDMVDINQRAIDLSVHNVELNNTEANVFKSDGFSNIKNKYDFSIVDETKRTLKPKSYASNFANNRRSSWTH